MEYHRSADEDIKISSRTKQKELFRLTLVVNYYKSVNENSLFLICDCKLQLTIMVVPNVNSISAVEFGAYRNREKVCLDCPISSQKKVSW